MRPDRLLDPDEPLGREFIEEHFLDRFVAGRNAGGTVIPDKALIAEGGDASTNLVRLLEDGGFDAGMFESPCNRESCDTGSDNGNFHGFDSTRCRLASLLLGEEPLNIHATRAWIFEEGLGVEGNVHGDLTSG